MISQKEEKNIRRSTQRSALCKINRQALACHRKTAGRKACTLSGKSFVAVGRIGILLCIVTMIMLSCAA